MKNKKKKIVKPAKDASIYIHLSLLVLVPLILNWKIINYDFTRLDDSSIITTNIGFLSNISNILGVFERDNFLTKGGKGYYRPVQSLSFKLDAQISGEKPWAYHFSNLLYHILTAIALFFLLRMLGIKNNLSFFMALLFSVHPLFTDAIAWIVGRGDILAGLFGTAAFISFIKYDETKKKIYFYLHFILFALALFSKEISVVLPLAIIFYYLLVNKRKYNVRELVPFFISWILVVISFFFLRNRFLNHQEVLSFDSFVKNLPQIPIYFAKLFLPLNLSPMPVFTIFYTAVGILLLILSAVYLYKFKSTTNIALIWGIVWFLMFLLPGMLVRIALGKYQFEYLECRVYMPSIGIFLAVGVLLNDFFKKDEILILLKYFSPLIVVFSVISFVYSNVFAAPLNFYSEAIKSNPDNVYAMCSRGCLYAGSENLDLALSDFNNSIRIVPKYSEAYYDKAALYNAKGDHLSAENYYSEALKYDTLYPKINTLHEYAYINLSAIKYSLKKFDETISLLKKAEWKYPDNSSIHNNLGLAYYAKAEYSSALSEYSRAISSDPTIFSYFNNRGMANYQLKNYKDALIDFNKSLETNPAFTDALTNRGITKKDLADYNGAISDLSIVINLNPNDRIALYFRGVAYSKLNMVTEAENDIKRASDLGFKMPK